MSTQSVPVQGGTLNPKYAAGLKKANLSHFSSQVTMGLARAVAEITQSKYDYAICALYQPVIYIAALGMMEGSLKYGRHNYRVAEVNTDTYFGATNRHIDDWWHRESIDPYAKGNLHHVGKGMSSLHVILDALASGMVVDDRPPRIDFPQSETKTLHTPKKLKASVCYAEIKYHLTMWWEGKDFDVRSKHGAHHLYLAMAWMHELLKAILENTIVDDRPPRPHNKKWMEEANAHAVELLEERKRHGEPASPFTEKWMEEQRSLATSSPNTRKVKVKRPLKMKKVR